MTHTYQASFEYLDVDNKVHSTTLLFTADTTRQVVEGPFRWWENRTANVPQLFNQLLYVECAPYTVGNIKPDGTCTTGSGWRLYEWSEDRTMMNPERFIEYMTQRLQNI